MSVVQSRKLLNIISLMGIAVTISLSIYFYRLGVFDDMNSLQQLVGQSPIAGPLIFVVIRFIRNTTIGLMIRVLINCSP